MKTYLALLATAILLAASAPANANGGKVWDYTLIRKVPELKQACKDASRPGWDSGITSKMLKATYDYSHCLIGIVQQILDAYYPADNHDIINRVNNIASKINPLYWDIYCLREEACGTMYIVLSAGATAGFIEDILETMVTHIESEMQ